MHKHEGEGKLLGATKSVAAVRERRRVEEAMGAAQEAISEEGNIVVPGTTAQNPIFP